jgi:hypothetical protein
MRRAVHPLTRRNTMRRKDRSRNRRQIAIRGVHTFRTRYRHPQTPRQHSHRGWYEALTGQIRRKESGHGQR